MAHIFLVENVSSNYVDLQTPYPISLGNFKAFLGVYYKLNRYYQNQDINCQRFMRMCGNKL